MPAGLDGNPKPLVTLERSTVIEAVAVLIAGQSEQKRPLLVGVDGIDGSGKSTFADELDGALRGRGLAVVRSTIDSFHNPASVRYQRGKSSPAGFFLDSHDLVAVRTQLLDPFAAGIGTFVDAVFDVEHECVVENAPRPVQGVDVLLFDGIFLQRDELADYWDLTVFLDAQQRVDLRRLGYVIADLPTEPMDVVSHVLAWDRRIDRYSSGMQYYLDLVDPLTAADVVIDNNDLSHPVITKRPQ